MTLGDIKEDLNLTNNMYHVWKTWYYKDVVFPEMVY